MLQTFSFLSSFLCINNYHTHTFPSPKKLFFLAIWSLFASSCSRYKYEFPFPPTPIFLVSSLLLTLLSVPSHLPRFLLALLSALSHVPCFLPPSNSSPSLWLFSYLLPVSFPSLSHSSGHFSSISPSPPLLPAPFLSTHPTLFSLAILPLLPSPS